MNGGRDMKIKLEQVKYGPTEVDDQDVDKMATEYKRIEDNIAFLQAQKEKLKDELLEAKVKKYFDDGTKLVYLQGRAKNSIDKIKIVSELTYDELLKVSDIKESELKNLERSPGDKFGEKLLVANKFKVNEGTPSLKYGKMNRDELKEYNANK